MGAVKPSQEPIYVWSFTIDLTSSTVVSLKYSVA
jgi:hypothetical protein